MFVGCSRRVTRPAWLGTLRRTRPLSADFGYDRGTPIDRYDIERFSLGIGHISPAACSR